MKNRIKLAYSSLAVALLLGGASACVCAAGYFGIPIQQIETRAELLRSQASGLPISDTDISNHLSRIDAARRAYGVTGIFISAACLAIVVALVLLSNRDSTHTP